MGEDEKPLLGSKKEEVYGSFAQKDGYSASPKGLAGIVSESQIGALEAYGGPQGLLAEISPNATLKDGLKEADTDGLREKYGENGLAPPPKPNLMELIVSAAMDPTLLMLLGSAGVSLAVSNDYLEGASIGITVCLVVGITALTDYNKAMDFRKQMLDLENDKHVDVVRNGSSTTIHPGKLVVGDVVRLAVGDIAPADGLLFQGSDDLKMDESALTGETELIKKSAWSGSKGDDVDPFIVSGTNVMQGTGLFLVLAVGSNSIQGKILARIQEEEDNDPEEEDDEDAPKGCVAAIKSFFTFGGGDQGAGLLEKLETLAVDIGKMGTLVALGVFFIMLAEFIFKEFIKDVTCSPLTDEDSCSSTTGCGFSDGQCSRHFGGDDIGVINEYFMTAITILVVAVPEGLPLAQTLALGISMRRMMGDANQVKHMDSTETMGSATTICSDKTGTLTENKMTVMKARFAGETHEHVVGESSSHTDTLGSVLKDKLGAEAKSRLLAEAIVLNVAPTAKVELKESGEAKYEGNPTDCALIKLAMQLGFKMQEIRAPFQNAESMLDWGEHNIPFSSERKRMSWIVPKTSESLPYDGKFRLYSKGAPQQIFDNCGSIVTSVNDKGVPSSEKLSDSKKQEVMDLVSKWQDGGLRTLGLAYREIKDKPRGGWESAGDLESDMTLLAVVGIEDPLRATVPSAIQDCAKAGIDVRMCTGDALSTAIAIAKGCKILRSKDLDSSGKPKPGFAMTGAEFDDRVHLKDPDKPKVVRRVFDPKINDAVDKLAEQFKFDESGNKVLDQQAFDDLWPTLRVLARCQPEDKLTLVRVVAVTGDGTNDAPALKSANVGFAMGIAGTETAKQACDIVLLDDNFASIVKAVMWGRNVFDSISKFIQFQLTVNVVAIALAVIGAFTYNESPLTAVQMLWVNMIMDSLASLALATEMPTKELLDRMPYGKRRPVISPVMTSNIVGHSIYQIAILFWVLFKPSTLPIDPPVEFEPHKGSLNWSIFFNVFVMLQLFNEFNARHLPTPEKLRTTLSEWNVFAGVFSNPNFVGIMVGSFAFQIILVQYVGEPVSVVPGGLSSSQWIFCVGAGAGSLVWQLLINAVLVFLEPTSFEEEKIDSTIQGGRKASLEEIEAAPEETAGSNWNKVRLGVRRDILFSRAFNTSVRNGVKLGKLVRSSEQARRSADYYQMLGKQLSRKSLAVKKTS